MYNRVFYRFVCFLIYIGAHIFYRFKFSGTENIPKDGPFILCCNHIHSYDPAMVAICTKRRLRFMAKKELFRTKIKGAFFRAMGAFPVDREATDFTSYRRAMNALSSGMGLLIFSQGTKLKTLNIKGAKGGVAIFGVKSGAPIIPVGITGTYRLFSRLTIRFGEAVSLDSYDKRLKTEQIEQIMSGIMAEVEKLVD